jgi:hypothetical protein
MAKRRLILGTAGLGRISAISLARHNPAHIYYTGRNVEAAKSVAEDIMKVNSSVETTFVKMDMLSLADVKKACGKFVHDRLDILM